MATVASTKRQQTHTSNTYESDSTVTVGTNIVMNTSCTVDGRDVSADGVKLDGIACGATACTGTVSNLGNLGITATATELNYTTNVTSDIQAQLNGKSPTAGSTSLTTLGNIGTGTWQGTVIADAYIASASTWNANTSCCGTVRCVNTGTGLTGGAITETGTISINSTCNACWNAKTTCTGTVRCVNTGTGLTGGAITDTGTISIDSTVARTNVAETFSNNVDIDGVLTLHTAGKRVLSWLDVGTSWSFAGLPFFYKTAASTANRLDGVAPANLQTSQSASQIAQSVFNSYFNDIGGYSGAGTNFSRPIGVSFKAGFFISGADSAKIRFMVGMTSTSGRYADEDPATTHGFGVEFRRAAGNAFEWRVYGHNGTTLTASAWSSAVYSIGVPRTIGIFSDGSGNITAYTSFYGDTNYTTITTTGGPTTTAGGTATQHVGAAASTNVSNYVTGALAQMRVIAVNFYTAP